MALPRDHELAGMSTSTQSCFSGPGAAAAIGFFHGPCFADSGRFAPHSYKSPQPDRGCQIGTRASGFDAMLAEVADRDEVFAKAKTGCSKTFWIERRT